jgi:hypothetical protein
MTALVTADVHLNSNPRDSYRHDFFNLTLADMLRLHKPQQLIILGDLTDDKEGHDAWLVNSMARYIHWCAQICPVIILRGNHDGVNPAEPFFGFLDTIENVTFIDDQHAEQIEGLGLCTFLAHTRDHKKDWKKVDFDPYEADPECGFIFCHNTFEGALARPGSPLKGIPTNALPANASVLSGDVHLPQDVDQVTYVGAPYTVTFGDTYDPRVLLIGRTKRGTIYTESKPVPGKRKITIDVRNATILPKLNANRGDMVKVRVYLKTDEYAKWNEIKTSVMRWGERAEVEICQIQPVKVLSGQRLLRKASENTSLNDQQRLKAFCQRRAVPDDVAKTGAWLMRET